jgi:hypothetical protein
MLSALKSVAKAAVRARSARGKVWPLPELCAKATKELFADARKDSDPVVILALAHHRFMPDLEVLAKSGHVRILAFPRYWQFAPLSWFEGDYFALGKERQEFLTAFMRVYLKLMKVDCVVGTALWYKHDVPWGAAAEAAGTPYVVFHKESFKATEEQQLTTLARANLVGCFRGTHLVVHNTTIRDLLQRGGFVPDTKVSALGCLRMDHLVDCANGVAPRPPERDHATLFSFSHGIGLDDMQVPQWPQNPYIGWVRLFEQVHAGFARFALANPDLRCVIKTKWGGNWFIYIEKALLANGLVLADIPNLRLTEDDNPHDLMMRSKVVAGFNSTTLLEAGILGLPIIVPHFAEAVDSRYSARVKLAERYDLFDVAHSPDEFERLLQRHAADSSVRPEVIAARRELFEKWVSSLDGAAMPKYLALLRSVTTRSAA